LSLKADEDRELSKAIYFDSKYTSVKYSRYKKEHDFKRRESPRKNEE